MGSQNVEIDRLTQARVVIIRGLQSLAVREQGPLHQRQPAQAHVEPRETAADVRELESGLSSDMSPDL